MTTATFLRPDLGLTVDGLRAVLDEDQAATQIQEIPLGSIEFDLASETPSVSFGSYTAPAGEGTLDAFADYLSIPKPFLKRLGRDVGRDVQQTVLRSIIESTPASAAAIRFGEGGVSGVFEPGKTPFDPRALVQVASRVVGGTGVVQRQINTGSDFGFDVHVPFGSDTGIGGSGETVEVPDSLAGYSWASHTLLGDGQQVGDVTAGGIRMGVDIKHGLAPWVQPFMFRLVCTNGMETTDDGLKVDARGLSVDQVLADLEAQAQRAFSRVEQQIEHFYNLRNQRVDNPERAIMRLGAERGLPQRSIRALMEAAPGDALPDNPTMFDVVNLVTNLANSPSIRNDGGRLLLERAGGAVVSDEAERCGHCLQKV